MMGREIRRVPPNWKHPRKDDQFIPLFEDYYEHADRWIENFEKWQRKEDPFASEEDYEKYRYFWEWDGPPPEKKDYVEFYYEKSKYKNVDLTWYQVYETVTEGTPTTPAFETKEELIQYLVNYGSCDGHDKPLTREQAERFVESEWSPSGIVTIVEHKGKQKVKIYEGLRAPKELFEEKVK